MDSCFIAEQPVETPNEGYRRQIDLYCSSVSLSQTPPFPVAISCWRQRRSISLAIPLPRRAVSNTLSAQPKTISLEIGVPSALRKLQRQPLSRMNDMKTKCLFFLLGWPHRNESLAGEGSEIRRSLRVRVKLPGLIRPRFMSRGIVFFGHARTRMRCGHVLTFLSLGGLVNV